MTASETAPLEGSVSVTRFEMTMMKMMKMIMTMMTLMIMTILMIMTRMLFLVQIITFTFIQLDGQCACKPAVGGDPDARRFSSYKYSCTRARIILYLLMSSLHVTFLLLT